VNGDGYSDVIVGADNYDNGNACEGVAFVFLGGANGIASGGPGGAALLESNKVCSRMGFSVAAAGDVNGDGYGDVIVGARSYNNGESLEGVAFVFHGGPGGIASGGPGTAAAVLESNQAGAWLGYSVASAGDVNGDGFADVIVGAPRYTSGETEEGAAFVFLGGPSGVGNGSPANADATLQSNQANADFGASVASAGDVDGDAYADVIVGAPLYNNALADEGAAFVFQGSASGVANGNPTTAAVLESNQAGAQLGFGVAPAGDVDGNGYADVIVGAPRYGNGQSQEGAAFVFEGGPSGIANGDPTTAATLLESDLDGSWLGYSVASAGDVNGDGYADVIAGALHFYDDGQTSEGSAFVFPGGSGGVASGTPATAAAVLESNQVGAGLGVSVASAGDVNGDGFADVIAGAYLYNDPETDEGAAFLYYGNGNRSGRPALATQFRGASSLTVHPWGSAYSPDFAVGLRRNDPGTNSKSKLEVQRCPVGVPFGHASCASAVSTSWSSASVLMHVLTGLTDGGLYRWRARLLYAPSQVTQPGITPAPNPRHGPWRRFAAQSVEADVRVGLDFDLDGLRDSIDPDDDNDGLSDVAEAALGTNPLDPDHDDDGDLDGADNCPLIVNPAQQNGDSYSAGDDCQCGDTTGDGTLSPIDYTRAREHVVGRTPSGAFVLERCDVSGDAECDVADLAILDRLAQGQPATIVYGCEAFTGP
jgi:hypothetical protein